MSSAHAWNSLWRGLHRPYSDGNDTLNELLGHHFAQETNLLISTIILHRVTLATLVLHQVPACLL
jgi:hypothetical protein